MASTTRGTSGRWKVEAAALHRYTSPHRTYYGPAEASKRRAEAFLSMRYLLVVPRACVACLPKRPHSSFMWCRSLTGRSRQQETRLSCHRAETTDDTVPSLASLPALQER